MKIKFIQTRDSQVEPIRNMNKIDIIWGIIVNDSKDLSEASEKMNRTYGYVPDIPEARHLINERKEMKEKEIETKEIEEFSKVRAWGEIRGVGHSSCAQNQYQRFLQEGVEIHEAIVNNDIHEAKDAIGDTIVTLINLSKILGFKTEEGLDQAFNVIELRKGITTEGGDFVRYKKLSQEDQKWCDQNQGSEGSEYFERSGLLEFGPENFRK